MPLPTPLALLWWFAIGACIGSFLNVCIYRLPKDQSIVKPRSRCPGCERMIAWHDNVPLLSYLVLRAKCRHCKAPISWRYPVVEALTGALTVAIVSRFGAGAVGWAYLLFVWTLIVISFIDLEYRIIPNILSIGGLILGWIISPLVPQLHGTTEPLVAAARACFGSLIGCSILYLTASIGSFMFQKEAMGLGDVDLLAMAGAFLGWKLVVFTFFAAPMLALAPGIIVLLRKQSHEIPYGPFLSMGLVLAMFAAEPILYASGLEESARWIWAVYSQPR